MQQELRRQSPSALSSTRPVALRMGLSATCVQNRTSRGERGVRVETEGLSATGTIGGANGGPQRHLRNHGVWIVRLTGQVGNLTMRLSDNTQYGWLRGQRPCIIARARSLRAARTLCIPTRISFDVRSPFTQVDTRGSRFASVEVKLGGPRAATRAVPSVAFTTWRHSSIASIRDFAYLVTVQP